MSPRRRRSKKNSSQSKPQPGWVMFADTWPDWEHQGAPAPHPLIVVKTMDDRRVLLMPISTKDLGKVNVPLSEVDYPTIFEDGKPLSAACAIVIADKFGSRTNVWGELKGDVLLLGNLSIKVRNGKQLSQDEWEHLKVRIMEAGKQLP